MDVGPGIDPVLHRWLTCTYNPDCWDYLARRELIYDPRKRFEVDTLEAQRPNSLDQEQLFQR